MKFAITASDRYLGVWEAFVAQGWEPVKLFTTPVDNRLHHNQAVLNYARAQGIDAQISPLGEADLADLARRGCDALIVASYSWRIGDWRPYLRYAVNFHPSPLPQARGAYPIVAAILGGYDTWGVTCHRLDPEFDSGPILASRNFPLAPDESHESLDLKVQMAARTLAADVAGNFTDYWQNARPKGEGTYFKLWTTADRTLDLTQPVATILRRVRAFGQIECLAVVNEVTVYVHKAVGWEESHSFRPGALVHVNAMQMLIAVQDGFVGIVEWSLQPPDAPTGTLHR